MIVSAVQIREAIEASMMHAARARRTTADTARPLTYSHTGEILTKTVNSSEVSDSQ